MSARIIPGASAPMVDAATYQADRERHAAAPPIKLDGDKLADRLFWEAQRALRIERGWRGRRVEPGQLDIERLVLAGALTTKVDRRCPHQQDWDECPVCCH